MPALAQATPVALSIIEPSDGETIFSSGGSYAEFLARIDTGSASAIDRVILEVRRGGTGAWNQITLNQQNNNLVLRDARLISWSLLTLAMTDTWQVRARALVGGQPDTSTPPSIIIRFASVLDSCDQASYGEEAGVADDALTRELLAAAGAESGVIDGSMTVPETLLPTDRRIAFTRRDSMGFTLPVTAQRTSGGFTVALQLPEGALRKSGGAPADTARFVFVGGRGGMPRAVRSALRSAGVTLPHYWASIRLDTAGGTVRALTAPCTITLSYGDADGDGVDDSTGVDMTRAVLFTLTDDSRLEPLSGVTRNASARTITAFTTHFSPFFLAPDTGLSTAGLSRILVGPNPYTPSDPEFAANGITPGIYFKNLPPSWRIEIFTLAGQRVIEFTSVTTGSAGRAHVAWDARNGRNEPVTTGYYLWIVTDLATGQRVTGKVAVVR